MNDEVIKPITLVKKEFTSEIVKTINSSALPMFLIEYILKDILNEIHINVTQQLQEDERKYEQEVKRQKNKEKK